MSTTISWIVPGAFSKFSPSWDYNSGEWFVICDLCTSRVVVGEGYGIDNVMDNHVARCCVRLVWIKA
jgi:hypothetical protein